MSDLYNKNVGEYLEIAYKYLKEVYSLKDINKAEIINRIGLAQPKIGIAELVGKRYKRNTEILVENINGLEDCLAVLNECKLLIDGEYPIACELAHFKKHRLYRIDMVAKNYIIKIHSQSAIKITYR